MIELSESYQKRPIRFLELWEINDWKIKMYGISYKNDLPSHDLISKAKEIAQQSLPVPAITENRYGAGFVGVHDGKDANFIYLSIGGQMKMSFNIMYTYLPRRSQICLKNILIQA
nr:hypothetical protein [Priestia megaterium]